MPVISIGRLWSVCLSVWSVGVQDKKIKEVAKRATFYNLRKFFCLFVVFYRYVTWSSIISFNKLDFRVYENHVRGIINTW